MKLGKLAVFGFLDGTLDRNRDAVRQRLDVILDLHQVLRAKLLDHVCNEGEVGDVS